MIRSMTFGDGFDLGADFAPIEGLVKDAMRSPHPVSGQCGDTDGPAENQEPPVRQLRGPYRGKHRADHAANKHFKAYQVH